MPTVLVCPHCESQNWNKSELLMYNPAQRYCSDCSRAFVEGEQKKIEVKPPPVISAELLPLDKVTSSGNIYPRDVVMQAIREIKPHLTMRKVMGEFNPVVNQLEVKLGAAATIVTNMYFKDDVLMADLEIMPTPRGEDLKKYLKAGGGVHVTPRGVGKTEKIEGSEDNVVQTYTIVTVDVYSIPEDEFEY